jgi:hypothetical protein
MELLTKVVDAWSRACDLGCRKLQTFERFNLWLIQAALVPMSFGASLFAENQRPN